MPSGDAIAPNSFPPKLNPTNNAIRGTGMTKAWELDTFLLLRGGFFRHDNLLFREIALPLNVSH